MNGGPELTTNNADFLRSLPKAELHLHLEGSVDPETLSELSRRHNTPLPTANNRYSNIEDSGRVFSVEEARALYDYQDFTGFLLAFKAVTERLRTAEDYELITYRLMEKLAAQHVLHAEVYVSVGVIFWRGQPFDPLFEGMERGRVRGERDFGIVAPLDLRCGAPIRRRRSAQGGGEGYRVPRAQCGGLRHRWRRAAGRA